MGRGGGGACFALLESRELYYASIASPSNEVFALAGMRRRGASLAAVALMFFEGGSAHGDVFELDAVAALRRGARVLMGV